MTQSQRILIVSDGGELKRARARLEQYGFAVTVANDCDTALVELSESPFEVAVVNLEPAAGAVEFVRRVRATTQLAGILILIVAEWGTGEPTLALSAGADAYEPTEAKPIDPNRLITSIERLLRRQLAGANVETL